jgi:hypothetical protein
MCETKPRKRKGKMLRVKRKKEKRSLVQNVN